MALFPPGWQFVGGKWFKSNNPTEGGGYVGTSAGRDLPGTYGGGGTGTYVGGDWQGQGNDPLDAWKWAFGKSEGAANKAFDRLGGGQFLGGTLGQGAQSRYLNPTGFDPAALEAMKSELAQMWAGNRAAGISALNEQANARGVDPGSMGLMRGESQVRNMSTQGLTSDIRNLLMENERAKLQQSGTAAGLSGQLAALEAAMNQSYASGQLGRQFPVAPGLGDESGNGGYMFIDPATGAVGAAPPGGWTPEAFRKMQEERVRWLRQQQGMAA
jgi:hypothetical protein